MDSVTQATLGAAVAHLCWHKYMGRGALLAGATLGTLPDLDIVAYPVLDAIQRLYWHRSESHSIWFILSGSLLSGLFLDRFLKKNRLGIIKAISGVFLIFSTHVLIDVFNIYGTQLLAPVTLERFALGNMFIIDPFFSAPLLAGTILAFISTSKTLSMRINGAGLVLAALYAAWSFTAQSIAASNFNQALAQQGFSVTRQITSATAFNTILWRHVAQTPEGDFIIGYRSLLDQQTRPIKFITISQNKSLVAPIRSSPAFEVIDWFSQGWWFATKSNEHTVKIVDLRFSEIPVARQHDNSMEWPFAWNLSLDNDDKSFLQTVQPEVDNYLSSLKLLAIRIQGKKDLF